MGLRDKLRQIKGSRPDATSAGGAAERFPPDYRLVLTEAQTAAYLDVIDLLFRLTRGTRALTDGYAWVVSPQLVWEKLRADQHGSILFHLRGEVFELAAAQRMFPAVTPKTVPLVCNDAPEGAPHDGVALSGGEIRLLALEAGYSPMQKGWESHLNDLLDPQEGGPGYRSLVLLRERLRMMVGQGTRCNSCGQFVIPPYSSGDDSTVPLIVTLCRACLQEDERLRDWENMSEHTRGAIAERIAREMHSKARQPRRGPLP